MGSGSFLFAWATLFRRNRFLLHQIRQIIFRNVIMTLHLAIWRCSALLFWRWNTFGVCESTHLLRRLSVLVPLHLSGKHVDFLWLVDLARLVDLRWVWCPSWGWRWNQLIVSFWNILILFLTVTETSHMRCKWLCTKQILTLRSSDWKIWIRDTDNLDILSMTRGNQGKMILVLKSSTEVTRLSSHDLVLLALLLTYGPIQSIEVIKLCCGKWAQVKMHIVICSNVFETRIRTCKSLGDMIINKFLERDILIPRV